MTVRDRPGGSVLADELREFCATKLHRYQVPELIEFVDSLPKTATGKIERYKLRLPRERPRLRTDTLRQGTLSLDAASSEVPAHEALTEELAPAEEALVRAAYRLIASKGIERTTLQDIADAAGVSKALAVYYFKTKENLLLATIRWVLGRVAERMTGVVASVEAPQRRCMPWSTRSSSIPDATATSTSRTRHSLARPRATSASTSST